MTKINNISKLKERRQELRNNCTSAEKHLWRFLKSSQLDGRKFRRQHSIKYYILDFYCPVERIAIELDGNVHDSINAQEYDKNRDEFLRANAIKVLRFKNVQVFEEIDFVLETIKNAFVK